MAQNMPSLIVCLVAMAAFLEATSATNKYEVGGSFGWNVPPNSSFYSEWASTKTFFVGDALEFKSNSTENSGYAEVSTKIEYDNCTFPGIWLIGLTTILMESGTHYFISNVKNNCEAGQKLMINVSALPGSTPPPSSAPSLAYSYGSALLFTTAAALSLTLH